MKKESILKSNFPKLKVDIGIFKHRNTGEIRFCVMGVSTQLTKTQTMYVFDASEWDKLDNKKLEGVERIQECYDNDMLKQVEKHDEYKTNK